MRLPRGREQRLVHQFPHFALVQDELPPGDLGQGISKSIVFALLITLIGVSTGFSVTGGAEGVGRATTRAVVLSICWIIIADMIFSFFLNR